MAWDGDRAKADRRAAERVFAEEHGCDGPWVCFHCGGAIEHRRGDALRDPENVSFADSLVAHHVDYDPSNNELGNVVPSHHRCNAADMSPRSSELRSRAARQRQVERWAAMSADERTAEMRRIGARASREGRAKGGAAAAAVIHSTKLPDGRSAVAARAGAASAALTPAQHRERSLKGWEARRRREVSDD